MSEEMAVSDNASGDDAKVNNDESSSSTPVEASTASPEQQDEPDAPQTVASPDKAEEAMSVDPAPSSEPLDPPMQDSKSVESKAEPPGDETILSTEEKCQPVDELPSSVDAPSSDNNQQSVDEDVPPVEEDPQPENDEIAIKEGTEKQTTEEEQIIAVKETEEQHPIAATETEEQLPIAAKESEEEQPITAKDTEELPIAAKEMEEELPISAKETEQQLPIAKELEQQLPMDTESAPSEEESAKDTDNVSETAMEDVGEDADRCSIEVPPLKQEVNDGETEVLEAKVEKDDEELEDVVPKEEQESEEIEEDEVALKGDSVEKGIKRRASAAFSDVGDEEFKGFEEAKVDLRVDTRDYSRILERLEAEMSAASQGLTPVKQVMATPPAPLRSTKRAKTDTDGSRPSSALSSRSDGDGVTDASTATSPAARGRRATTEMSSPLLRVPLERGWKRELVYRAALDAHSRRNADIYYYTPYNKKLRSTREVAEHLSGTGLTLENFSFFKEPLGIDDPEKEIIRDAKLMRRVESPVAASAPPASVEGKRTPKPKPPKGASPEPVAPATKQPDPNVKSPPAKIKVKSVGSRLSNSGTPTPTPTKQQKKPQQQTPQQQAPGSNADNNNTAAWKKPRPRPAPSPPALAPAAPETPMAPETPLAPAAPLAPAPQSPPQPPPLTSRPPPALLQPTPQRISQGSERGTQAALQPCSMTCGRGVPTLACGACLCLYHAACVGHSAPSASPFLCKNCRKSSSPPLEPPPLTHKSGVTTQSLPVPVPVPVPAPVPRRVSVPVPVPVPVPAKVPRDKKLLLRMKVASGGADGERVWAVSGAQGQASPKPQTPPQSASHQQPTHVPVPTHVSQPVPIPRTRPPRPALPQSLAILNGRRFIVVPRSMVQTAANNEDKRRGRVANGAASPPVATLSPRRRGRQKVEETDHFTAFCNKAQDNSYNVVVQIFQYLGMRDLAHCARVCKLWKQLAATPALWRHVRMKNSHVSDWAGLCAALKRHGTKRLDLRKMLLPQNDTVFWEQFAQHISTVDTLERIEMCRCPASAVEAVCRGLPGLRALSALAIRDAHLDPAPLGALPLLHELRLKSMAGLSLTRDLRHLAALTRLQHLSLTSIKELGWCACDVIGSLPQLESLELGECTFRAEFAEVLARLGKLRRLRLERGTPHCAAPDILRALARLPQLTRLELVNIDVKVGFDDALAECKNIQRLLIIPTYVSQSATTNKQVLSGVLRLKDTLTHLMWGVTIELLRVTELFIDQCEQTGDAKRRDVGECIPVLKPVPGCKLPDERHHVAGPPQVEILPLPTLQRLLSAQLPTTKLKLLRIPFHATWRQSLADFQ